MITIDGSKDIYTLINVFNVEPENHLALFEHLKEATEQVFIKMPGYISANLHISDDKKTVTNYAQWESLEDDQKIFENEEVQKHMKLAASFAIDFKPVMYDQIWSHEPESNG